MSHWINFCDAQPTRPGWYLWRHLGKLHVIFIYLPDNSAIPQMLAFQVGCDVWTPLLDMDGAWLPIDLKEVEKLALNNS